MNSRINNVADTTKGSKIDSHFRRGMRPSNPIIVWLGLVAYLVLVAVLLKTIVPVTFVDRSQAAFFEPVALITMSVLGLIGVWLSTKTGFPDPLDPRISQLQRFGTPILIGLAAGTLFLVTDLVTGMSRLQVEQLNVPTTDLAFPASAFVYSAGAIYSEIIFRLFTIPVLLWLISKLFLRGRHQEATFWVLAILTSTIEPSTQMGYRVLPLLPLLFVVLQSFGLNLAQATMFRKYGFLAAITIRLAFYLIYHYVGAPFK
jgi:hypothetical protein